MTLHKTILPACLGLAALSTVAAASSSSFDGRWHVAIAAKAGNCPAQYSLPLNVTGGEVRYGGMFAHASGQVSAGGSVKVEVSYKNDVVRASGALNDSHGAGSWTSPTRDCSGTWTARRAS